MSIHWSQRTDVLLAILAAPSCWERITVTQVQVTGSSYTLFMLRN